MSETINFTNEVQSVLATTNVPEEVAKAVETMTVKDLAQIVPLLGDLLVKNVVEKLGRMNVVPCAHLWTDLRACNQFGIPVRAWRDAEAQGALPEPAVNVDRRNQRDRSFKLWTTSQVYQAFKVLEARCRKDTREKLRLAIAYLEPHKMDLP